MRWFPSSARCCEADKTVESAVIEAVRVEIGWNPPSVRPRRKRAKMIRHYRVRDEAHFWHWSDVEVVKI